MDKYTKITQGFVVQVFDSTGSAISQEFVAGDNVEFEFDGSPINVGDMPRGGNEYLPFEMKQPDELA